MQNSNPSLNHQKTPKPQDPPHANTPDPTFHTKVTICTKIQTGQDRCASSQRNMRCRCRVHNAIPDITWTCGIGTSSLKAPSRYTCLQQNLTFNNLVKSMSLKRKRSSLSISSSNQERKPNTSKRHLGAINEQRGIKARNCTMASTC